MTKDACIITIPLQKNNTVLSWKGIELAKTCKSEVKFLQVFCFSVNASHMLSAVFAGEKTTNIWKKKKFNNLSCLPTYVLKMLQTCKGVRKVMHALKEYLKGVVKGSPLLFCHHFCESHRFSAGDKGKIQPAGASLGAAAGFCGGDLHHWILLKFSRCLF